METTQEFFQTSLTREILLQSFQEAIELNICAKKKLYIFKRNYYQKIGDKMNVAFIDEEMNSFPEIIRDEMQNLEFIIQDFSKQNIQVVLYQISKLQSEAKSYLYEKMKQKRRQKSLVPLKNSNDGKKYQTKQNYLNNVKIAVQNIAQLQRGKTIEEVTEISSNNTSTIENF